MLLSALAAVLVVALWWLFLYTPVQDEISAVQDEISAAEAETTSLQQRVTALEAVRARAPETEAALARITSIVPEDPALAGALRQIEAAGEDAGVDISQISISRPAVVDEAVGLYSSSVALALEGSYFQVVDLLRRLEDPAITSRGLVLTNVSLAPSEYPVLSGSMNGQMFSILETPPEPAGPEPATPTEEPTTDDEGDADTEDEA